MIFLVLFSVASSKLTILSKEIQFQEYLKFNQSALEFRDDNPTAEYFEFKIILPQNVTQNPFKMTAERNGSDLNGHFELRYGHILDRESIPFYHVIIEAFSANGTVIDAENFNITVS